MILLLIKKGLQRRSKYELKFIPGGPIIYGSDYPHLFRKLDPDLLQTAQKKEVKDT